MTPTDRVAHPPRLATWLVDLFASAREADVILGDLHEEFTAVFARDGRTQARRWYWRQSMRTIAHLAVGPFRGKPWPTFGIGVAGLALTWPLFWATSFASRAIVVRYPVYDYVSAQLFWEINSLLPSFIAGWVIARVARNRPMTAALSIVLAMAVLMAVVDPIVVSVLDPRPERTVGSFALRAVSGLLTFGLPVIGGAVIGRKLTWRSHPEPVRFSVS